MHYAPAGTLHTRHPKGVALPLAIVVSYIKQVADALHLWLLSGSTPILALLVYHSALFGTDLQS